MEKLQVKADRWNDVKKRIKNSYPDLQETDLQFEQGQEEQFLSRLQEKTGRNRDELVKELNKFSTSSI